MTTVSTWRAAPASPRPPSPACSTGQASVNAEARLRVLAATAELRFQPNRMAQSLRSGRGRAVAMLVGDIEQSLYSALTMHVQAVLGQIGLDLPQPGPAPQLPRYGAVARAERPGARDDRRDPRRSLTRCCARCSAAV
jgi:hypothetical protein